jgi:uncharacterized membrane protein HdeD (DUF308 family)
LRRAALLLFFIAAWAIVLGIFDIVGAIRLRKAIEGQRLLILNGAVVQAVTAVTSHAATSWQCPL